MPRDHLRSVLIESDIAIVFATADIKLAFPGKPEFVYGGRYTCAYISREGQWRMLALQMQMQMQDQAK